MKIKWIKASQILLASTVAGTSLAGPAYAQVPSPAQFVLSAAAEYSVEKTSTKMIYQGVNKATLSTGGVRILSDKGALVVLGESTADRTAEWAAIKKAAVDQRKAMAKKQFIDGLKGKEVLVKLGPETLSFFVALGTIQYFKMIFNPSLNSMGVYQQVESEKHPLSHVSFGAFMWANGVVAPPLQLLLDPKNKMQKYIPYLGMSAGMMASNLVNELSAVFSGSLDKCVAELDKQINNFDEIMPACDKAYENWTAYSIDKLQDMFPSIVSMAVSTVLGAQLNELVLKKIAVKIGANVLISFFVPGTLPARFIGWIGHTIGEVGGFVAVDEVTGAPLIRGMKVYGQSAHIKYLQEDLTRNLLEAKKDKWSSASTRTLTESVLETYKKAKEWKNLNLTKINEAYSAWLSKVSQFSATYNLSKFVYGQFVEKALVPSFQGITLTRRAAPLYGITYDDGGRNEELLKNPDAIMQFQLRHIVEAVEVWLKIVPQEIEKLRTAKKPEVQEYQKSFETHMKSALALQAAAEKALALANIDSLTSVDDYFATCNKIGEYLLAMNKRLGYKDPFPGLSPGYKSIEFIADPRSSDYQVLSSLRTALGNPFPLMQPGALFFAALERSKEVRSNSPLLAGEMTRAGQFRGLRPAQTLFAQMLFGPSIEQSGEFFKPMSTMLPFIKVGAGISSMQPPRLVKDSVELSLVSSRAVRTKDSDPFTVLNVPVLDHGVEFPSLYDYALKQAKKDFVVKDRRSFEKMWEEKVLPGYKESWEKLDVHYRGFIQSLMESLRSSDFSMTNRGPFSNGVLKTIQTERKLYLMILGELIRDLDISELTSYSKPQALQKLTNETLNRKVVATGVFGGGFRQANISELPLLESLDRNQDLVFFDHLAQQPNFASQFYKGQTPLFLEKKPGQNLKIQDRLLADFEKLDAIINQIQIKEEKNGSITLKSGYSNNDINELREAITQKYDLWINLQEAPIAGLVQQMSDSQLELYVTVLRALRSLATDLSTYALMTNEFSFERSNGLPGQSGTVDPNSKRANGGVMGTGGFKPTTTH